MKCHWNWPDQLYLHEIRISGGARTEGRNAPCKNADVHHGEIPTGHAAITGTLPHSVGSNYIDVSEKIKEKKVNR